MSERKCYSSKKEICLALKDLNLAIGVLTIMQEILEDNYKAMDADHRLPYIKGIKVQLKSEIKFIKYLHQTGEYCSKNNPPAYQWTKSKTDLVELAYALYESKSINQGDILLEKFVQDFARFFGVNIEKSSRIFINIKQRKTESRTTFLNTLANMLNNRMVKDDEK